MSVIAVAGETEEERSCFWGSRGAFNSEPWSGRLPHLVQLKFKSG